MIVGRWFRRFYHFYLHSIESYTLQFVTSLTLFLKMVHVNHSHLLSEHQTLSRSSSFFRTLWIWNGHNIYYITITLNNLYQWFTKLNITQKNNYKSVFFWERTINLQTWSSTWLIMSRISFSPSFHFCWCRSKSVFISIIT
jgi:hypothetical protein